VPDNTLYYGDNLAILRSRDYFPDASVDLVYLDPPFNSNATYNVLFAERSGAQAASQIKAFEDTWRWDAEAARVYFETVEAGGHVSEALQAFRRLIGDSNMLAYLAMMAPRLVELRRVLKLTGCIYLHCDPTASHYLKILMDAVFGPENFRNEIIWRRTGTHSKVLRFGPIHDTILFYTRGKTYTWNSPKRPYMRGHIKKHFVQDAEGWRTNYSGNVLTGSGTRNGESGKPWKGFDPTAKGRHWALPRTIVEDCEEDLTGLTQHEKLDRLYELGYILIDPKQVWPFYEHRLKPSDGTPIPDIWANQPYTQGTVFGTEACIDEDAHWLSTSDSERLGYPTQKPVGLLTRIIEASSNPGDMVLDPFCGCGTAVDAAQKLGRRWTGIDVTFLAVDLIRRRLVAAHGSAVEFDVTGVPRDEASAHQLFKRSHFEFERWAVSLVDGEPKAKPGGDRGIDGVARFPLDAKAKGATGRVLISVKGGKDIKPEYVRELEGTVRSHKAEMGLLVTLEKPTQGMTDTANHFGTYEWPISKNAGRAFPRIQIVTVGDLVAGHKPQLPPILTPYLSARRSERATQQIPLDA